MIRSLVMTRLIGSFKTFHSASSHDIALGDDAHRRPASSTTTTAPMRLSTSSATPRTVDLT
jgi:hypothetical protein